MSKTAVILAGGVGTRLKPYSVTFPKPLMPIGERPILEIIVRQLKSHGFQKLIFAVNHQAELIRAFFGDGSKWGTEIEYSLETTPLGTMGPLRIIPHLPDNYLVMNGDVLTNLHYGDFLSWHLQMNSPFTISAFQRRDPSRYGVLEIQGADTLVGFKEKPPLITNVSMGVYAVSKRATELIPKNEPFGFDQLMLKMIETQARPRVKMFEGYWLDIGIPADYEHATEFFLENEKLFLPE